MVFINYAIELDGQRQGIAGIGRSLDSMVDLIGEDRIGEVSIPRKISSSDKVLPFNWSFKSQLTFHRICPKITKF